MASTKIKTDNLWTEYNGKKFAAEYAEYSERASKDVDGNAIVDTYATKDPMVGATSQEAGEAGLVPAPAIADKDKFLKGDGTWDEPPRVSLDDYYYDVYGNGLSATRHNTSLAVSATLLGTSGNVNSADLSAQFSLSWGGSVINMINVNTTNPNGSYWAFGAGSNKGARYMLPPPSSGSVKYAVNKADGGIYWDTIPTATASGTGVTGNDGLMTAADKAKVDSFREVTDSEVDNLFGAFIGGRNYRTVIIGNQMWLAENLDFLPEGITLHNESPTTADFSTAGAWYCNNDQSTAQSRGYGLLYNTMAVEYLEANKATLFPGWHVPTEADMNAFVGTGSVARRNSMRKAVDWAGSSWDNGAATNSTGFSAIPCGIITNGTPPYYNAEGAGMEMWSGTVNGAGNRYYVPIGGAWTFYVNTHGNSDYFCCSIRLVKDIT